MKIQPYYEVPFEDYLFKDRVRTTPEEKVRQWVLHELIKTYGYPKDWINKRILIEFPVHMGVDTKYCDIVILNLEEEPFVMIETKQELIKDKGKEQLRSYLAATYTANIGMWSNGKSLQCYRKMRDPNRVIPEPDIPSYEPGKGMKDKRKYSATPRAGTDRNTGQLQVFKGKQFEDFLFKCHCVLRDEDGLQPDEAVDEMIKLLYVKSFDELFTEKNKDFRFQEYNVSSTEELASTILSLYKEAQDEEKKRFKEDPSRCVFDEDLIIKSSTIRKIVQLLQGFSIVDSSSDEKGRAFERFLSKTFRKGLGQYFTPEPVVDILVGILDPNENDVIIDPACGSARMLTHCIEHVSKNKDKDEEKFQKFCLENTRGIDIARKLTRIAAIDAWMHEDGKKINVDILNMDSLDDFDKYPFDKGYATIAITNPPFGSNISTESTLRRFSVARKNDKLVNSVQKEVLFLNRCFELVKPGGKVGIVMPDGVLANSNMKFVRDWYRQQGKLVAVISLPQETFMPFGAGVKTSLIFFRKWTTEELKIRKEKDAGPLDKFMNKEKSKQEKKLDDYEVYMARVDSIGYDATGREKGKPETEEIVKDFHKNQRWE